MGGEGKSTCLFFKHWTALSYELTATRETSLTELWNLGSSDSHKQATPQHNKSNSSVLEKWIRQNKMQ